MTTKKRITETRAELLNQQAEANQLLQRLQAVQQETQNQVNQVVTQLVSIQGGLEALDSLEAKSSAQ